MAFSFLSTITTSYWSPPPSTESAWVDEALPHKTLLAEVVELPQTTL
jgi:hypothetical protein